MQAASLQNFPAFLVFFFLGTIPSWFAWHRYPRMSTCSIQMKHVSVWFGKWWSLHLSQVCWSGVFFCCFLAIWSCEGKDRDAQQWEQGSDAIIGHETNYMKHPWAEIINCYRRKEHIGNGKVPTSLTSRQDTNSDFSQLPPFLPDWHSCAELVLENGVSLLEPLFDHKGRKELITLSKRATEKTVLPCFHRRVCTAWPVIFLEGSPSRPLDLCLGQGSRK